MSSDESEIDLDDLHDNPVPSRGSSDLAGFEDPRQTVRLDDGTCPLCGVLADARHPCSFPVHRCMPPHGVLLTFAKTAVRQC